MANTYKWTINALDAKISHDGKSNVVDVIHWGYSAVDNDDATKIASSIGTHNLEYDKDSFIEYDKIKESDVIGWLEAALDVDDMKANLDAQIALLKAPVSKTFHTPFVEVVEE